MFSVHRLKNSIVNQMLPVGSNCIFFDPSNCDNVICTLGVPERDDALNMISTAMDMMSKDGATGNISFISMPTQAYQEWLKTRRNKNDTYLNREAYLFGNPPHLEEVKKEWEKSKRNKVDIAFVLAFAVPLPPLEEGLECFTHYRLTKEACAQITQIIKGLCKEPDCEVCVTREVIHWGDYLQNVDQYFWDGLSVLNGLGRYYRGADLEQRYGTAMDARYIAPILCVPVVIRRPLPQVIPLSDARAYLSDCIISIGRETAALFDAFAASEIYPQCLYDILLPVSSLVQEIDKIFADKGMTYSVRS